eukprot:SAG11_NODE_212_length_12275_cov_5.098308_6_plen_209_part_00
MCYRLHKADSKRARTKWVNDSEMKRKKAKQGEREAKERKRREQESARAARLRARSVSCMEKFADGEALCNVLTMERSMRSLDYLLSTNIRTCMRRRRRHTTEASLFRDTCRARRHEHHRVATSGGVYEIRLRLCATTVDTSTTARVRAHRRSSRLNLRHSPQGDGTFHGTRSTSTEGSVLYRSSVSYKIEQYYDEDCSHIGEVRLVGN